MYALCAQDVEYKFHQCQFHWTLGLGINTLKKRTCICYFAEKCHWESRRFSEASKVREFPKLASISSARHRMYNIYTFFLHRRNLTRRAKVNLNERWASSDLILFVAALRRECVLRRAPSSAFDVCVCLLKAAASEKSPPTSHTLFSASHIIHNTHTLRQWIDGWMDVSCLPAPYYLASET